MRAAIEESLVELGAFLIRARKDGYIPEPWLGDPISADVASFYNAQVMDSREGAYAAMRAYEQELVRVRDTLLQMEEQYRRAEATNEDRMRA